ncbi:MAG: hypothetical protein K9L74_01090 [Candidatus Izimaplasma sp.]|nr:hypothetical protein [Candidatus Izimaplasma bacterium]
MKKRLLIAIIISLVLLLIQPLVYQKILRYRFPITFPIQYNTMIVIGLGFFIPGVLALLSIVYSRTNKNLLLASTSLLIISVMRVLQLLQKISPKITFTIYPHDIPFDFTMFVAFIGSFIIYLVGTNLYRSELFSNVHSTSYIIVSVLFIFNYSYFRSFVYMFRRAEFFPQSVYVAMFQITSFLIVLFQGIILVFSVKKTYEDENYRRKKFKQNKRR